VSGTDSHPWVQGLRRLAGGRIQRVDRFSDRGIYLEIRFPGHTLHILFEGAGPGAVRTSRRRPAKEVEGAELQRYLRKRLVGAIVCGAERVGGVLHIGLERGELHFDPRAKEWIRVVPEPRWSLPEETTVPVELPELEAAPAPTVELKRDAQLKRLRAERKRLARLASRVEADVERLQRLEASALDGELLKPHLHEIPRGATEFEVVDYAQGVTRKVSLDPALGPRENLQRIFQRAKKGARGRPIAASRAEEARRRVAAIEAEMARWEAADADALIRLEAETKAPAPSDGRPPARRRSKEVDRWSRRYEALDGSEIRVGKSAKGNDRLSTGARGHDLWLHARGLPGAHVVLRTEPGKEARPEAVLDAAHLALHFSDAKNEAKAEVIVTEARHVKKTKGAAAGAVGVAQSRTLLVALEPERLRRLLGQEGPEVVR